MPDIKVRVGQQNAVKVVASAFGGSLTAENAQFAVNVVGGIASVTQLNVTGVSTFGGSVHIAGITTLASSGGITTTGGDLFIGGSLNTNDLSVAGVATFGTTSVVVDGDNDLITVGTGLTLGGVEGVITPSLFVSGVSTFIGNIDVDGHTELDNLNISGVSTFAGAIDANGDLDVDGHTELDDVNVSGAITATTFTGNLDGTVNTAAQPNITSLGTLSAVTISGDITANGNIAGDGATNITGIASVTATTLAGTLQTAAQPNITSVGTLTSLNVAGVSTFGGRIVGAATSNVIPFLYSNFSDLPSASTYHGAFAHVHARGKGYFAHSSNWYELVNKEINGTIGVGTERYNIGPTNITTLNVSGVSTFVQDAQFDGNVSIAGTLTKEDVTNIDSVGLITARSGVRITSGGLIVTAGVSTFAADINVSTGDLTVSTGDLTVSSGDFVVTSGDVTVGGDTAITGTLTAGLIDGGTY